MEIKSKNEPKPPSEKWKRKIATVLFEEDSEEENLSSNFQNDDEDCPCIYSNDLFSRSKPAMCLKCLHWAHASCADVSKKNKAFYL